MSNLKDHEAEQAAITAACEHIEAHKLTYTVIVTRDVTESTVIQLTAPTEQQACDMALELSGREGTKWERDDVVRPASENYVTDVSVAEPAPAPQHVTAVMPDLAVLSLPLGGTMILELGRCIEPAGLFRSAKVIRNYKDTGAARAWCDGYARRHKQGGN